MKIRLPTRDDGEKFMKFVRELEQEGTLEAGELKSHFPWGMLNLINENKASCLFAEDNSNIVAFCNAIYKDKTATVGIYVLKQYRATGLAQKIYKLIEDECKANGIIQLISRVKFKNERSKKFFEKLGFKTSGKDETDYTLDKELIR